MNLKNTDYAGTVDGEHAVMNYSGGGWYIEDLDSENGTRIQRGGEGKMNYFILDNKNYYDNIWDYYMSPNNIYDKLTIQLMEQYNAFNQQMKTVEDEYVLRGAILQCTHGNRYTYLDICKDYGIYYSSEAVMTCQDDKINENVYNFALCGNKHYEPTYSKDVMPNEDKGKDLNGCIQNKYNPILYIFLLRKLIYLRTIMDLTVNIVEC